MSRQDIIKNFLEYDIQIDNTTLNYIERERLNVNQLLSQIRKLKQKPKILTLEIVKNILPEKEEIKIAILKDEQSVSKKTSVSDLIETTNKNFDFFKKLLSSHLELVNQISIGKISDKIKKFSLIAKVREKQIEPEGILIEDQTGEIFIKVSSRIKNLIETLIEGEIIGVLCEKKGNETEAVEVVFPDVPMRREINFSQNEIKCFFISDLHFSQIKVKEQPIQKLIEEINKQKNNKLLVFVLGDVDFHSENFENFVNLLPSNALKFFVVNNAADLDEREDSFVIRSPAYVRIVDKITILLVNKEDLCQKILEDNRLSCDEKLVTILKKRNLNPTTDITKLNDRKQLVIEQVPDILVSSYLGNPTYRSYKGINIISCGDILENPTYYLVDLKTRETIKINFP